MSKGAKHDELEIIKINQSQDNDPEADADNTDNAANVQEVQAPDQQQHDEIVSPEEPHSLKLFAMKQFCEDKKDAAGDYK